MLLLENIIFPNINCNDSSFQFKIKHCYNNLSSLSMHSLLIVKWMRSSYLRPSGEEQRYGCMAHISKNPHDSKERLFSILSRYILYEMKSWPTKEFSNKQKFSHLSPNFCSMPEINWRIWHQLSMWVSYFCYCKSLNSYSLEICSYTCNVKSHILI